MAASIYALFFIILPTNCMAIDDFPFGKNRFENIEELELQVVSAGNITKKLIPGNQPIKLNCMSKIVNFAGNNVTWFYKPCGPGTNRGTCESIMVRNSEDIPLCGVATLQVCSPRLTLDRPTSGLYRCYQMEKKAGYVITATLVNTFQLEIMDRSMKAPEFEEVPEDLSATVGSMVTFTCKVRSTLPLHVNWYRQVEKLNSQGTIQYEKKFYQSLNVTEISIKGDLVSQLKLKRIAPKDSGIYACGAINEAGIRYREAKLTVKDVKADDRIGKKLKYDEWKWAIIASAIVLGVLLLKCLFCWRLLKSAFSIDAHQQPGYLQNGRDQTQNRSMVNRKKPEFYRAAPETGNETSDYEQVFTL